MRKCLSVVCTCCLLMALLPTLVLQAYAVDQTETAPYIQRLISYYLHHQEAARENMDDLLAKIESIDPQQGAVWKRIMDTWEYTNTEMPVHLDVLPDGLPQDDSLCIVALGYGLSGSGAMKPELYDRLQVALASARKYPNAFVAVCGGETSGLAGVSEAGEMAKWLLENGVAENRLIIENQSLSTTANAVNLYGILTASYPQVYSVAIVTSDYHVPWGCMMFSTVSEYGYSYQDKPYLEVVGNAACATSNTSDTLSSQAWGISTIAGVSFDPNTVPALHMHQETAVETTQLLAETVVEVEEKDHFWMFLAAGLVVLAIVVLFLPTKKKAKKEEPYPRRRMKKQ